MCKSPYYLHSYSIFSSPQLHRPLLFSHPFSYLPSLFSLTITFSHSLIFPHSSPLLSSTFFAPFPSLLSFPLSLPSLIPPLLHTYHPYLPIVTGGSVGWTRHGGWEEHRTLRNHSSRGLEGRNESKYRSLLFVRTLFSMRYQCSVQQDLFFYSNP